MKWSIVRVPCLFDYMQAPNKCNSKPLWKRFRFWSEIELSGRHCLQGLKAISQTRSGVSALTCWYTQLIDMSTIITHPNVRYHSVSIPKAGQPSHIYCNATAYWETIRAQESAISNNFTQCHIEILNHLWETVRTWCRKHTYIHDKFMHSLVCLMTGP